MDLLEMTTETLPDGRVAYFPVEAPKGRINFAPPLRFTDPESEPADQSFDDSSALPVIDKLRTAALRVIDHINAEIRTIPRDFRGEWIAERGLFEGFLHATAHPKIIALERRLRTIAERCRQAFLVINTGGYEHFDGSNVRPHGAAIADQFAERADLANQAADELREFATRYATYAEAEPCMAERESMAQQIDNFAGTVRVMVSRTVKDGYVVNEPVRLFDHWHSDGFLPSAQPKPGATWLPVGVL
jgi:hypothetical protein